MTPPTPLDPRPSLDTWSITDNIGGVNSNDGCSREMHDEGEGQTSIHLRRAVKKDWESLEWIVERFTPLLRAQAELRIPGRLRTLMDPDDLVSDVWAITLGKLEMIGAIDRRFTPMFVKFLSTTLLHRAGTLLQKHIQGKPWQVQATGEEGQDPLQSLSAEDSSLLTKVHRSDLQQRVQAAIRNLGDLDREIVILRGIEQVSNADVARKLKMPENSVAQRYRRALGKLRDALPGSVFDELGEGESA